MAAGANGLALDGTKMNDVSRSLRVMFCCTGVGIFNRGIESFFRDSFDGLKNAMPGIEVRLIKGAGSPADRERAVSCLPRTGKLAEVAGILIGRNAYVAEQLSSLPFVLMEICRWKPHVVFYSDSNLGFQLFRWRRVTGVDFKLLFSNGGPCHPPFVRTDFIHQVAPLYLEEAIVAGESAQRHFLVPYGINLVQQPCYDPLVKRRCREELGLPLDRPILLSVGWIRRQHKRMDYLIEEVARLSEPRPFLQLLGAMDQGSVEIVALAERLLGTGNFSVRSVPYEQVMEFYKAADCFVLASLTEGFGRVYIEALMHGLPVIAHQHPVMEYVVGDAGQIVDMAHPGVLAKRLLQVLGQDSPEQVQRWRWERVRDRFSWPVLAPSYARMFQTVAGRVDGLTEESSGMRPGVAEPASL